MSFEYTNARISSRFKHLLPAQVLKEMLGYSSMEELLNKLRNTPYEPFVSKAYAHYKGINAYFHVLKYRFQKESEDVMRFSIEEGRKLIGLFLSRWDLKNIMTIIRGKYFRIRREDIEDSIMPFGSISYQKLKLLMDEENPTAVIDKLLSMRTYMSSVLTSDVVRLINEGKLFEAELRLYEKHFSRINKILMEAEDSQYLRKAIAYFIDLRNIVSLLLMLYDGVKPQNVAYIRGGHLRNDLEKLWQAESFEDALKTLQTTMYGKVVEGKHRVEEIEFALERFIYEQLYSFKSRDNLGIGLAISYLSRLESEIRDLRLIGIAIHRNVDRSKIQPYMFLEA